MRLDTNPKEKEAERWKRERGRNEERKKGGEKPGSI